MPADYAGHLEDAARASTVPFGRILLIKITIVAWMLFAFLIYAVVVIIDAFTPTRLRAGYLGD